MIDDLVEYIKSKHHPTGFGTRIVGRRIVGRRTADRHHVDQLLVCYHLPVNRFRRVAQRIRWPNLKLRRNVLEYVPLWMGS